MGNYKELKAAVANVIKTNGNQEITGLVLQNTLATIINQVGANATFVGIATPETNPGVPDQNVFYIASKPGVYVNFNNEELIGTSIGIFVNNRGSWVLKELNINTFNGVYSTSINLDNFTDNIKSPGVYIRRESRLKSSRGQILFVSTGADNVIYQREIYIDNNGYNIERSRKFDNSSWTAWEDRSAVLDGYYSTENNTYRHIDNIKSPGVYIRRESRLKSSRGQILFVSTGADNVIYQREIYIDNNGYNIERSRKFDNSSWTAWEDNRLLILPILSNGSPIAITNDKIKLVGNVYMYYKNKRILLNNTEIDLNVTKAVSKVIYNTIDGTFTNVAAAYNVNSDNIYTIAFIYRSGDDGNVVSALINSGNYSINGVNVLVNATKKSGYYNPSKIKWISHRGVRNNEIPENTPFSVMFARLYKQQYAECDIRYTSDNVAVIMHDVTINRTMQNIDGSIIVGDVSIASTDYNTLRTNYVYKSTNALYRTPICTFEQYIDACKEWNICPIIQGVMKRDELEYVYRSIGDNFIIYGGDYKSAREISDNILYLTSRDYGSVDNTINALNAIGGRVGLSRLSAASLSDEMINALKDNKMEIMASYAYEKKSIPDAVEKGVTIVLSDNVCGRCDDIVMSSIANWDDFITNGTIVDNQLRLFSTQSVEWNLSRGIFNIFIEYIGDGKITIPTYSDTGVYGNTTFELSSNVFMYNPLYLNDANKIILISNGDMTIKRIIINGDSNIL